MTASAVGAPLEAPFFRVPYAAELVGPSLSKHRPAGIASEGGNVTVGLIQYPEQDHWPIFDDLDANRRYVEFIRSSLLTVHKLFRRTANFKTVIG